MPLKPLVEGGAANGGMAAAPAEGHLGALDGWRGISILSVLACHLLPLGPKELRINTLAAQFGMSLFFTLSGFLITTMLLKRPDARAFFIRRLCRILPLAYLFIVVAMLIQGKGPYFYAAHFLFLNNYQAQYSTDLTEHFWSLCVEIHFYLATGLIVLLAGRKGLWLLPLLGLAITGLRIATGTYASFLTHLRADEIFAGAILGLVHTSPRLAAARQQMTRIPVLIWLLLLLAASHPYASPVVYARPYIAAALIGNSLWSTTWLASILASRPLRYCAETSYALYVIHPFAAHGWFASGSVWVKYLLKRPLTIAITLAAAHLSTFYYEKKWIAWGKKWSNRRTEAPMESAAAARSSEAVSVGAAQFSGATTDGAPSDKTLPPGAT